MKKLSSDMRTILVQAFLGLGLMAYILTVRPNPAFTRGLLMGYGGAVAITLILIVIFRIRGRRRFGDSDERETLIMGRASTITLAFTVFGFAAYVLAAYALPGLRGLNAVELAAIAVGAMGAVLGIVYAILNR